MKRFIRVEPTRLSRKTKTLAVVIGTIVGWLFIAPSHAQNAPSGQSQQTQQSEQSELKSGSQVYMQARCFACHGQNGFGGAGPRFRENRFLGLADYVIGQILVGRDIMPPYESKLNDAQIAAVATYVRNSWGNNFGPVKPEQVAAVRKDVNIHPPQGTPHVPELPPPEQQPPSSAK